MTNKLHRPLAHLQPDGQWLASRFFHYSKKANLKEKPSEERISHCLSNNK